MAQAVYQPTVSEATMAKAEKIAEMIPSLSTGRDKATGIRFVIVPSSDEPQTIGHTATALWCSCLGWKRHSICSHQLAVSLYNRRQTAARIALAQQKRRENGQCRSVGCILTAEQNPLGLCSDHARVLRASVLEAWTA